MAKIVVDARDSGDEESWVGAVVARESELRALLGEPGEGDGYKVSLEWRGRVFEDGKADAGGIPFTIHDWKETSLYDEDLLTPAHLRELDFPREWTIAGRNKRTAELVLEALREAGIGRAGVVV